MALLWGSLLIIVLVSQQAICDSDNVEKPAQPKADSKPPVFADVASAVLGAIFPNLPTGQTGEKQKIDKRQFSGYPGSYIPGLSRSFSDSYDPYAALGYHQPRPVGRSYGSPASYPAYPSYHGDRLRDGPPRHYSQSPYMDYGLLSTPIYPSLAPAMEHENLRMPPQRGRHSMPMSPYPRPTLATYANPLARTDMHHAYPHGLSSGMPRGLSSGMPRGLGSGMLRGRTDLPPSYVYPFAREGTLITPDRADNQPFALSNGGRNVPRNPLDDYYAPRPRHHQYDILYPYYDEIRNYPIYPSSMYSPRHYWKRGENETAPKEPLSDLAKFEEGLKQLARGSLNSLKPKKIPGSKRRKDISDPLSDLRISQRTSQKDAKIPEPAVEMPVKRRRPLKVDEISGKPQIKVPISQESSSKDTNIANLVGVPLDTAEPGQLSLKPVVLKPVVPEKLEKSQEKFAVKTDTKQRQARAEVRRRQPRPVANPVKPRRPAVDTVSTCPSCLPFNATSAIGTFSLVYGNFKSLELVYSSLAILTLSMEEKGDVADFFVPGCVQLDVEPYVKVTRDQDVLPASLTYSVNDTNTVHISRGILKHSVGANPFALHFGRVFSMPLCLVRAHMHPQFGYDYMVFAETEGEERCRNIHIFARDRGHFDNLYTGRTAKYVREEINEGHINPVQRIPNPDLCARVSQQTSPS